MLEKVGRMSSITLDLQRRLDVSEVSLEGRQDSYKSRRGKMAHTING